MSVTHITLSVLCLCVRGSTWQKWLSRTVVLVEWLVHRPKTSSVVGSHFFYFFASDKIRLSRFLETKIHQIRKSNHAVSIVFWEHFILDHLVSNTISLQVQLFCLTAKQLSLQRNRIWNFLVCEKIRQIEEINRNRYCNCLFSNERVRQKKIGQ